MTKVKRGVTLLVASVVLILAAGYANADSGRYGKIAFTSDRDGNAEIYVMNSDGTNQVRLTHNNRVDDHPTWSPDGQRIAFLSERTRGFSIFIMKPDGTGKTEVTSVNYQRPVPWRGGDGWSMSWSPDGRQIVFSESGVSLVTVNADGTNRRSLISGYYPSWSPDGSKIMFLEGSYTNFPRLLTIRPNGTDVEDITPTLPNYYSVAGGPPVWSPDGLKIALALTDFVADTQINIANADGSNLYLFEGGCAPLVPEGCSGNSLPAWSPDGRTIAFINWGPASGMEIYAKNIGGSEVRRLTDTSGVNSNPNWQPRL